MKPIQLFVTATHTDAGKTFISSLLVRTLKANYWKPVQSGKIERDSDYILKNAKHTDLKVFPETYWLESPESPHSAAKKESIEIELNKFELPDTKKNLIIEGAGGILVPLNDNDSIADLIASLKLPIVLVVPTYLGCINHALLSLEAIKSRGLDLKAIIFNGDESIEAQKIILKKAGTVANFRVPRIESSNQHEIEQIVFGLRELFF